jgi:hypothetical protein
MKYVLTALALVAGNAMACQADGGKDAMAPNVSKPVADAKVTPIPAQTPATTTTKTVTKVAAKSTAEPRKPAPQ